ncbi:MFS transporter [Streptomyces sp. NPDC002680]|uniref:MFS transporter n=1 Tax=Streptomyces sp. NPDC002680 TaxID=3364659 RepID=UPI0036CFDB88
MPDVLNKPSGGSAPRNPTVIVVVLALAGISVSLMQTLVIPLVPDLPRLLDSSPADTAWIVTATLLAAAVATPVAGRLGDMYGKRRMLLVSLVLMTAGSALCALSDSLLPMLAGRVLQGLSAGVIPLGISVMRDEMPAERLGSATALMSASLGVGSALGLPLAALVADNFDWHFLFWGSAVLGALGATLVLLLVPESRVRTGGSFDLLGALGLSAALVSLLLAMSKGADWGWGSGTTLGLFAGAVVILLAWGRFELRTPQPLVKLRTIARREVLFTNLAGAAFGFSLFSLQMLVPQIVQLPERTGYGLGGDLLTVGLVMAPQGLVLMLMAPVSATISRAKGPKVTLMTGAVVVASGYALNLVLMSEIWQLILVACIIGAGVGLAYGALPLLLMGAVPPSETAATNSVNTLMRAIGTSIASALAGVIIAQMTTTFGGQALPSENAFKVIMAIGCGAALVSLALASFLPGRRPSVGASSTGNATKEPLAKADTSGARD